MRKKCIRNTAVWLGIALIACSLAGCGNSGGTDSLGAGDGPKNPAGISSGASFEGIHEVKAEITDKMIAEDGRTDYCILLPDDYGESEYLRDAASDLRLLLGDASEAEFEIVSESELPGGKKYISLGNTERAAADGIKAQPEVLGENGYRIVTEGENIYILGGGDVGTLNGIYGFLRETVDFGAYAPDEVYLKEGDIPLYNFDVTEVPDIQYRIGDVNTRIDGDELYRRRLRYNCNDDVFMYVNGTLYHNSLYYFEDYLDKEECASWFSSGKTQLCYTAHGNAEERKKMLEIAADAIVKTAKESDAHTVTFQQSDGDTWCDCPDCTAEKETYGTDAAVAVKFVNDLSDLLAIKLRDAGMGDRTINISFFAYMRTEKAPAVKDAAGNWQPIDESVRCRDNVSVFYAPINADYGKPFSEEYNSSEYENLRAWQAICKTCYVWLYQTNFSHYLYPYNSLPTMAERYKFVASCGAEFLFDQNQWDQKVKTGFHRLKAWMGAELAWNVNADYNSLLDEYFSRYFHDAAEPMRRLFDGITYHMERLAAEGMDGGIYYSVNQADFFDKALLDGWMAQIEEAYGKIGHYRDSDPELYKKLSTRICIESLSIRYMRLELYGSRFSPAELAAERNAFREDCLKTGVEMLSEQVSLSVIYEAWGLI